MDNKHLPSPEVLRQLLSYDPETGKLFWKERPRGAFTSQRACSTWNAQRAGKEALCNLDSDGYRQGGILGRMYKAHRVIWAMVYGAWPVSQVDHINCDKSDNRLCNLRAATNAQNRRNVGPNVNNSTGLKGVCWDKSKGKWKAHITVDGVKKHLGLFSDSAEASAAYRQAADRLHQDFARTV